jgi:hypothetical protein
MTILAASGDNGPSDGERSALAHADSPASSPWVTGCGGTRLIVSAGKTHESVWNDGPGSSSGGGVSNLFPVPDYQTKVGVPASVNPGYFLDRTKDENLTASEMGNSPEVVIKHYRALVRDADVTRYWRLAPDVVQEETARPHRRAQHKLWTILTRVCPSWWYPRRGRQERLGLRTGILDPP